MLEDCGIRISLDVRFRIKNPYQKRKKLYSLKEFANNKILKQGKFWHKPNSKLYNFKEKINYEYKEIEKINNPRILNLRKTYLKKIKY